MKDLKKSREQEEKKNDSQNTISLASLCALRKLNVHITALQWNKQH